MRVVSTNLLKEKYSGSIYERYIYKFKYIIRSM